MTRFLILFLLFASFKPALAIEITVQSDPTDPEATMKIEEMSFKIDHGQYPAKVNVRIADESRSISMDFEPVIGTAPMLMVNSSDHCLISLAPGCSDRPKEQAIEVKHRAHAGVALYKIMFDFTLLADSLVRLPHVSGREYILAEKPWHLNMNSFDNSKEHYYIYAREGDHRVHDASWTEIWLNTLNPKQKSILQKFNDFIVMRRLIRAGMNSRLIGFFPGPYLRLAGELRTYFHDFAITAEERTAFRQWLKTLDPTRTEPCLTVLGFSF